MSSHETAFPGPHDPQPFDILPGEPGAHCLLIADHAGLAIPERLKGLGVDFDSIADHRWHDVGSRALTQRLAEKLAVPAVLANYSRLVIDLNRTPESINSVYQPSPDIPSCISETIDGITIPANKNMPEEDRKQRLSGIFDAYHGRVDQELRRIKQQGILPALISIHSFTPYYEGQERPWHIGTLWYRDQRMAQPFMQNLRAQNPDMMIGDNEPYSLQDERYWQWNYSTRVHAEEQHLPNILIEVRNDLLRTEGQIEIMADILFQALDPVLTNEKLYKPL